MIYKGNGWPSNFDRGNCRMGIAKFLEREEGPFDTLEELLLEQEE